MQIVRWMARLGAAGVLVGVAAGAVAAEPPTDKQVSSFFRAVQMDDASTVRKMVGTVVNANELNPLGGEPALVLAIREGSAAVVQDLLAHPGTDLERKAVNGNTALMMAAFKRDGDTVRALLDKGAKVNQPGWTALHYAAASGDAAIAQLLIETDSPYLAPVPFRGRMNEPGYVAHVAEYIATLKGVSLRDVAAQTSENFFNLFQTARS